MPHLRHRHLQALVEHSLKYSPITGIFGHRQVGKTTLAQALAHQYRTLDRRPDQDFAAGDPEGFIEQNQSNPLVVDECQLAPPLFPALKEWVRTHPKPGQFLLTGSVRFSSKRDIRESLTGRIINWELLPMDLSEMHAKPLPDALIRLARGRSVELELKPSSYFSLKAYQSYLQTGGLPGVFAIRDEAIRRQRFETQLSTALERDLRLILQTTLSYSTLRNLLQILALEQGQPLELAAVSRSARISIPTLKKLLSSLQAMYMVRLIEVEGTEKKPVLFLEDQGEATFLARGRYDEPTDWLRFLYSNLRHQLIYRPEFSGRIFQFRTRGGAYVPLCFETPWDWIGIVPMIDESPTPQMLGSARSFTKRFPKSKILFVHPGKRDVVLSQKMRVLGARCLFNR